MLMLETAAWAPQWPMEGQLGRDSSHLFLRKIVCIVAALLTLLLILCTPFLSSAEPASVPLLIFRVEGLVLIYLLILSTLRELVLVAFHRLYLGW